MGFVGLCLSFKLKHSPPRDGRVEAMWPTVRYSSAAARELFPLCASALEPITLAKVPARPVLRLSPQPVRQPVSHCLIHIEHRLDQIRLAARSFPHPPPRPPPASRAALERPRARRRTTAPPASSSSVCARTLSFRLARFAEADVERERQSGFLHHVAHHSEAVQSLGEIAAAPSRFGEQRQRAGPTPSSAAAARRRRIRVAHSCSSVCLTLGCDYGAAYGLGVFGGMLKPESMKNILLMP